MNFIKYGVINDSNKDAIITIVQKVKNNKEYSKKFLEAQSLVYSDDSNKKKNFNSMVNACIECHKVKCSGPIERIKKLYID